MTTRDAAPGVTVIRGDLGELLADRIADVLRRAPVEAATRRSLAESVAGQFAAVLENFDEAAFVERAAG